MTNGIVSNPFLEYAFRTESYTITVTVHDDGTWSYELDTELVIPGQSEPFHHTDHNRLRKIGEPMLNPTAQAAAQHGQPHKRCAARLGQQRPRLVEQCLQAAVALGDVAQSGGQRRQPGAKLGGNLRGRYELRPAGRKLERQRKPLYQTANFRDRSAVQRHIATRLPRSLAKQRDGGFVGRQAFKRQHPFFLKVEPFARRDQQGHARRGGQQLAQQRQHARVARQMLNRIEQQQSNLAAIHPLA